MSATTHASFGRGTTATEVARAFPDRIEGKTFVITGTSPNSLGLAIALSLASQSPGLLVLASRTRSKLDAAVSDILSRHPGVNVKYVLLDLADSRNVRDGAAEITRLVGKAGIDGLFNNAGMFSGTRKLVKGGIKGEGLEVVFATNHLGPFLLTNLLMPLLHEGSRIVMTSSEAHRISPFRFSDYNQEPGRKVAPEDEPRRGIPKGLLRKDGGYEPIIAYGQSKTANVLMAVGLNARLKTRGVESFAVMPGAIMTGIVNGTDQEFMQGLSSIAESWKDLDQGAATMLVAALDPKLKSENGVYLNDCQVVKPSKWANDPQKAETLWKLSEDLVGEGFTYEKGSKL